MLCTPSSDIIQVNKSIRLRLPGHLHIREREESHVEGFGGET